MCDACYGLIHDILVSPLPASSPFHKHIHKPSMARAAPKLAKVLCRVLQTFKQGELFFICPTMFIHPDPLIQSHDHDAYIWRQFQNYYPANTPDLSHMIDILVDEAVIRKTAAHHQMAEIYMKSQFHSILKLVKDIHHEHSNKIHPPNPPSPGPVPKWKLEQLKSKNKKVSWIVIPTPQPVVGPGIPLRIQVPKSIDDDPLYW
jgi:hypothetical protein